MLDFQKLSTDYQQSLLRQAVPFWLKHSRDSRCGGYFDTLTVTGEVVEDDKSVIAQAQQTWVFAWLYNTLDGQAAWLDHARHGATFLSEFAHDRTLRCYARLDRRGRPVAPSADVTPDCYVAMAYTQLHRATRADEWAMLAKQTFVNLFTRWEEKNDSDSTDRPADGPHQLRHLSEPIALLKLLLEIRTLLSDDTWQTATEAVLQTILRAFLDRRSEVLHEFNLPGAGFLNTPEGRRLNVGLTCQLAGLLLDLCAQNGNRKLAPQAVAWCLQCCEQGWDKTTGGLNLYVDVKGLLSPFPNWQQKWAWVQLEAITTLAKGYFQTHHPDCLNVLKRLHDYTFQHFPDRNHLGWHLALDAYQQPILSLKSTQTVSCYSLIGCLAQTARLLTQFGQLKPAVRSTRSF